MSARLPWRRGARAASWPVAELVVTVATQVVLTPLLLHRLGAQQFGLWVLAQSALLASATLSLGASAGVLPVLSAALHRGDMAGARDAMDAFVRRVAVGASVGLAALAVAGATGWLPSLAPAWVAPQVWPLAAAVTGWLALTELDNGLGAALKAQGRFDVAAMTESAARLVQLAMIALVVGAGAVALVPILLSLAVSGAKVVVRWMALRPLFSATGMAASANGGTPGPVRHDMVATGLWIWLGALGSLAFNAFDRWFVGAWFGASTLAAYAVCTQLAQLPHAVAAAAGQVLVPWAARHAAVEPRGEAKRRGLPVLAVATALAALPSLLVLAVIEPALTAWISADFARAHGGLARGLTIAFLLLCLNVPGYFLLLGMGRARLTTLVISGCGVVFVGGALALPHDLSTFVLLKGVFAILALALPLYCAVAMTAAAPRKS